MLAQSVCLSEPEADRGKPQPAWGGGSDRGLGSSELRDRPAGDPVANASGSDKSGLVNASSYGYNPLAHAQGQTRDERFRNFDQLVLELAREALELAQRSGISKRD